LLVSLLVSLLYHCCIIVVGGGLIFLFPCSFTCLIQPRRTPPRPSTTANIVRRHEFFPGPHTGRGGTGARDQWVFIIVPLFSILLPIMLFHSKWI
jgi:hypothetical protein